MTPAEVRAAFIAVVGDPPRDMVRLYSLAPLMRAELDGDAASVRARGVVAFCKAYWLAERGPLGVLSPSANPTPDELNQLAASFLRCRGFAKLPERYRPPLFHDADSLKVLREWGGELYRTKSPAAIVPIILRHGALADDHCRYLFAELLESQMGFERADCDRLIQTHQQSGPLAALRIFVRMKSARDKGGTPRPLCMSVTKRDESRWLTACAESVKVLS